MMNIILRFKDNSTKEVGFAIDDNTLKYLPMNLEYKFRIESGKRLSIHYGEEKLSLKIPKTREFIVELD